jgi:ApbE superfamily uncharacterized protein (UPF0280 family)
MPNGRRMHFRHGPIDLVLQAHGQDEAVLEAELAAERRFATILQELCAELPLLRQPAGPNSKAPASGAARRMVTAVTPLAARAFITPMAAVAGAVADEILDAMTAAAPLARAYVNNGGDIALHLAGESRFNLGIVDRVERPRVAATARVAVGDGVRGVATSGWGGRSFSLGIADAVTILAEDAAAADAAATIVANAVDLPGHPAINRCRAMDVKPDSDLGKLPVTTGVGPLGEAEIQTALQNGLRAAEMLLAEGRIVAAALFLKGSSVTAGSLARPAVQRMAHYARH